MATEFYALMEDGSTIILIEEDYHAVKKMLMRNIERGAILKNGDILKTSAVYYLGSREPKPAVKPAAKMTGSARTTLKA